MELAVSSVCKSSLQTIGSLSRLQVPNSSSNDQIIIYFTAVTDPSRSVARTTRRAGGEMGGETLLQYGYMIGSSWLGECMRLWLDNVRRCFNPEVLL